MPIPTTNTKIGTYSDVELIHWTVRERHKGTNQQAELSGINNSFPSGTANQSMWFYDIINSEVRTNQLCLFSFWEQPENSNRVVYDTIADNTVCSICDHSLGEQEEDSTNLYNDQSYTIYKPYGQCFSSSTFIDCCDVKTKPVSIPPEEQYFDEQKNFAGCCPFCFEDCYSVSEDLDCPEEERSLAAASCLCSYFGLQFEEKNTLADNLQPWQWSMSTRRLLTPSTGTKCPES